MLQSRTERGKEEGGVDVNNNEFDASWSHKIVRLQIIGANVEAATYIMAAIFNSLDKDDIRDIEFEQSKKGENSIDVTLVLHYSSEVWPYISPIIFYLLGRRDSNSLRRKLRDLEKLPEAKRKIEPIKRGISYVFKKERTTIKEITINGIKISKETVKEEIFKDVWIISDSNGNHDNKNFWDK